MEYSKTKESFVMALELYKQSSLNYDSFVRLEDNVEMNEERQERYTTEFMERLFDEIQPFIPEEKLKEIILKLITS